MRLTGWILLVIGGLLCATISWAALGFLLMGIGLIALQVAERRRYRPDDAVPAGASGFTPPRLSAGLQPPTLDPGQDAGAQRQPRRVAWPDPKGDAPYDRETYDRETYDRESWRRLVDSDPDLAQLASVLADYGPQYVDELAASYLAAPDKGRLEAIVDGIIARARDGQKVPPTAPPDGSRPPPLPPRSEPRVSAPAAKPGAPPPAKPADMLEASLFAAVEEASAKLAAGRTDPPGPAKLATKPLASSAESRPLTASRREPLFGRTPRDSTPSAPPPTPSAPPPMPAAPPPMPAAPPPMPAAPPPMPSDTPADLEASLIAAVSEAAARRAEPSKPAPEAAPPAATREPEIRTVAPSPPQPAPPAPPSTKTPPAKTPPTKAPSAKSPADNLDETLLAALAEISGQKIKDGPKPDATKQPPGSPGDDGLSDRIKKFAPDSSFLRKK